MEISTTIKNGEITINIESRLEDWDLAKHIAELAANELCKPRKEINLAKLKKALNHK